ncbi:Dolichyl-diphosphooligosaccharide-protein glycosyltransferase subunit dad1 [Malassezia cuniculi]|uniref:DASH complex subunit DAD1 n=1 Tax=Malassezia cuniculi TaxID=948313 RepID=A0AAF0ER87_9BASI|nr:Dolichyl-diphosphooligosaccharide-protein glycosyltransferase subunit dad1 [Malassezia cuniculi]
MQNDAPRSYFERERDRLVTEIAENIESLIGSTNAANRKLEEHIAVGRGFESIAELWGRFSELMAQSGVPPVSARAQVPKKESSTQDKYAAGAETPHGAAT